MAATKTNAYYTWGGSNTGNSSSNSSTLSSSGAYEATVFGEIVVPASATQSPSVQLWESADGTNFYQFANKSFAPGTTQGTFAFPFELEAGTVASYLAFAAGSPAASITAQLSQVTG